LIELGRATPLDELTPCRRHRGSAQQARDEALDLFEMRR
jgi:hypothetical protein